MTDFQYVYILTSIGAPDHFYIGPTDDPAAI